MIELEETFMEDYNRRVHETCTVFRESVQIPLLRCPGCGKEFKELKNGLCNSCNRFGYKFIDGMLHCANNCIEKNGNMADCWREKFTCVNCGEKHTFEHDDPIHDSGEASHWWKCHTCGKYLDIKENRVSKQITFDNLFKGGADG